MRRLPVYLLLDVSGSMRGEPIEAVNQGIAILADTLRTDPYAPLFFDDDILTGVRSVLANYTHRKIQTFVYSICTHKHYNQDTS